MKLVILISLYVGLFFVIETKAQDASGGICENGGSLLTPPGGAPMCYCSSEYSGLRCELSTDPCASDTCQNGGYCSITTGGRMCTCAEGYGGKFCENMDETNSCPHIDFNSDGVLFPLCSVRKMGEMFMQCINEQLPYRDQNIDAPECRTKVSRTIFCLYDGLAECSRSLCPSIYNLPGAVDMLMSNIFVPLFNLDPATNFAFDLLCNNGSFNRSKFTLNFVGPPVCAETVFENILSILVTAQMNGLHAMEGEALCTELSSIKHQIYGQLSTSCDWTRIGEILPQVWGNDTGNFAMGIQISQNQFLEWFVTGCQSMPECEYRKCKNGGTCVRETDGVEYCMCADGYDGPQCDYPTGSCQNYTCHNNGTCFEAWNIVGCTCLPGFQGAQCQQRNDSQQCAVVSDEDDMLFFAKCSEKTLLSRFADCINHRLPYMNPQDIDLVKCKANLTDTAQCFHEVVEDCGGLSCANTMWEVPAFVRFYSEISNALFHPYSNFSIGVYEVICSGPGMDGLYHYPDHLFNIGQPVCQQDLLDNLIRLLVNASNAFLHAPTQLCSSLDMLRQGISAEVARSCDWSDFSALLTPSEIGALPVYEKALTIAQNYFPEWVIPPCRGSTGGLCEADTCKNGGYCSDTFNVIFCACAEGWGGDRCEETDATNVCPTPAQDDSLFLPLCTLKGTATRLETCITQLYPMLFGKTNRQTCDSAIRTSFQCVATIINDCSRSTCPSVWLIPGAAEIGAAIIGGLYNETIMFYAGQYLCHTPPAGGYLQFLDGMTFNIGAPVCPSSFLDELIAIAREAEKVLLAGADLQESCRIIQTSQTQIYNLISRCDFSMLRSILPQHYQAYGDLIIQGIEAAKTMLRDFVLPMCAGAGGGSDSCPQITSYSSQCQMVDAWMCQYFNFKKDQSMWMTQYMEWWMSCSGFAQKNWDDWASNMGLMRGDRMGRSSVGGSYGQEGFLRMVTANLPCPDVSYMDCGMGERFTNALGCTFCYRSGASVGNSRNLFMTWMTEHQQYQISMKIYNALRMECSGMSSGCEGGTSATTAMPTGSSSTFWPTGASSTFWPTGASSTFWPTGASSTFWPSTSPWSSSFSTSTDQGSGSGSESGSGSGHFTDEPGGSSTTFTTLTTMHGSNPSSSTPTESSTMSMPAPPPSGGP